MLNVTVYVTVAASSSPTIAELSVAVLASIVSLITTCAESSVLTASKTPGVTEVTPRANVSASIKTSSS